MGLFGGRPADRGLRRATLEAAASVRSDGERAGPEDASQIISVHKQSKPAEPGFANETDDGVRLAGGPKWIGFEPLLAREGDVDADPSAAFGLDCRDKTGVCRGVSATSRPR